MKIWAHTLVKNEARFLWYSVMSVVNYVDRVLLWDTGSSDSTKQVIQEIQARMGEKISVKLLDEVTSQTFANVRQEMLDETQADWFLVVDGDEIWFEDSIKTLTRTIKKQKSEIDAIVVPTINLVGDVFHFQEKAAGKYNFHNMRGHFNLRAVNRNIPGLKSDKPHGTWGWVDRNGRMIQNRRKDRVKYLNTPYLHATHLQRSSDLTKDKLVPKRRRKRKHEIGEQFSLDYYYPEVFFRKRPKIVFSPWETMTDQFRNRALVETPLRKVYRRSLLSFRKHGY